MNKKNILIWSSFLLVVLLAFIILVCFFFFNNNKTDSIDTAVQETTDIVEVPSDQDIYGEAVMSKNIEVCNKLNDVKLKETCLEVISDLNYYDEAIAQFNITICDNIKSDARKSDCMNMVRGGEDYFKKEDPQYLANTKAFNHNEEAIEQYEDLLKDDDTNVLNILSLALLYAEKGLKEQEQGKSQSAYVEKAFFLVDDAKQLDPENAEVYRVEGYVYEIEPDYIKSEETYDKAIELDPKNILAYIGKGHVLRMSGRLMGAIESLNNAVELDIDRKYANTYKDLCILENSRSNIEEALKNCEIVVNNTSVDLITKSEAYQILSNIYLKKADFAQANNYLLKAKELLPNDSNVYTALSKLNIFDKKYIEAENNARKATELSPNKAIAYLALARSLYMLDKYDESIRVAEEGLALVDNDVSLLTASKPVTKKELNYSISFCYGALSDEVNRDKYEKIAEASYKNSIYQNEQ